jgi:hypothetical protein
MGQVTLKGERFDKMPSMAEVAKMAAEARPGPTFPLSDTEFWGRKVQMDIDLYERNQRLPYWMRRK